MDFRMFKVTNFLFVSLTGAQTELDAKLKRPSNCSGYLICQQLALICC